MTAFLGHLPGEATIDIRFASRKLPVSVRVPPITPVDPFPFVPVPNYLPELPGSFPAAALPPAALAHPAPRAW